MLELYTRKYITILFPVLKNIKIAFSRDVIKFQNPKIKSHESLHPLQTEDYLNLYLFTAFQPNYVLGLETTVVPNLELRRWVAYLSDLVSFAAVIWVVTQRFSPTNGCLNPNPICFSLFRVHVKIIKCTNHALPIVSAETNHVTVVCQ